MMRNRALVSKLLIFKRKFSDTRKFTLRYEWFGMNFDFQISKVDFSGITISIQL